MMSEKIPGTSHTNSTIEELKQDPADAEIREDLASLITACLRAQRCPRQGWATGMFIT